jgi:hypothetical protein
VRPHLRHTFRLTLRPEAPSLVIGINFLALRGTESSNPFSSAAESECPDLWIRLQSVIHRNELEPSTRGRSTLTALVPGGVGGRGGWPACR